MVTDRTTATIPRPQHRACISLAFFSHVQVTMWQFGRTTSTLTMLEWKSLVDPPTPMAIASQTERSGKRPRICKDKEIVSSTCASFDNLIPLSTFTLKMKHWNKVIQVTITCFYVPYVRLLTSSPKSLLIYLRSITTSSGEVGTWHEPPIALTEAWFALAWFNTWKNKT